MPLVNTRGLKLLAEEEQRVGCDVRAKFILELGAKKIPSMDDFIRCGKHFHSDDGYQFIYKGYILEWKTSCQFHKVYWFGRRYA